MAVRQILCKIRKLQINLPEMRINNLPCITVGMQDRLTRKQFDVLSNSSKLVSMIKAGRSLYHGRKEPYPYGI